MLRRDLLRALVTTPLTVWLRPWMPRAFVGKSIPEPNAAAIYRTLFGWVERLREEEAQRIRNTATLAIDEPRIRGLLEQPVPVLKAMREAASIDHCDWGIETVGLADLCKGHLNASNSQLIRIACLSARRNARLGRGHDALDDVFAALTLARRIGTGGVLIARLLGYSDEFVAFQTLGRILTELDHAALDDLSRRLDQLPPPEPASAMIGPESRFILGSIRAKLEKVGPMLREEDWAELGCNPEEAATLKRLTRGDRAALLDHLDTNGPAFLELARRLDLPRAEYRASLDEFARAERADHPLVATLAEKVWNIRQVFDRVRALRAKLRAGLALIRDGEPAFRSVADPFGDGPFGLERRGKVYCIRSALSEEGGPELAFTIGYPD
jgi:hypothetical protein